MVERGKQVGHDTREAQAGLHSLDSRDSGTADLSEFPTQEFRQKELCGSAVSVRDIGLCLSA